MIANRNPNILVCGSCRVVSPVVQLARLNKIFLVNNSNLFYTHSPLETIQKVKMLKGEIPNRHMDLVVDGHPANVEDWGPDSLSNVDIAVIELSTSRTIELGGIYLNSTAVSKNSHQSDTRVKDIRETYIENSAFSDAIFELKRFFDRIIFVGVIHFNPDLKSISTHRSRLNHLVASHCDGYNYRFFNPNSFLKEEEQTSRLLSDNNHYTEKGDLIVRTNLWKVIQEFGHF